MPSVAWSIDASGATAGAEEFTRAAQTVERAGLAAAKAVDQLAQAQAQGGGTRAAEATRAQTDAITGLTRAQEQQLRVGTTLLSTLGGADRAFSQYTNATIRAAQATGTLVDGQNLLVQVQQRVLQAQSSGALERTFTTANINAKDLRLTLGGLNTSVGQLVSLFGLMGAPGGALAATTLQLAGAATAVEKLSGGFVTLGVLGTGIGVAVVGLTALAVAADKASEKFSELVHAAETVGTTTSQLQALRFAGTIEGVQNLETALEHFQRVIAEGSDPTILALRQIQLGTQDLAGPEVQRNLEMVARGLANMEDPSKRIAVTYALFGRNLSITPLLSQNAEGIQNLTDMAREFGVVMDEDAVKQAAKFHAQLEAGKLIITSWKDRLELEGIGVLIRMKDAFTAAKTEGSAFFAQLEAFGRTGTESGLGALGGDAAAALQSRRDFTAAMMGGGPGPAALPEGHPGPTAAELREQAAARERAAAAAEREAAALASSVRSDTVRGRELAARLEEQAQATEERQLKSVEAALDAQDKIIERQVEAQEKKDEAIAKRRAEILQEPFKEAARNIQNTLSSAIDDALSGSIASAKEWANEFAGIGRKLVSEMLATRITQPLFEKLFSFGGADVTGAGGAGWGDTQESAKQTAENTAATAENTGGLLTKLGGLIPALQSIGLGAAGVFGGLGIGASFGLKGGLGGLLGGAVGAGLGGIFGGPAGAAAGGAVGGLFGGEAVAGFSDLFQGRNPFSGQSGLSGAARGLAFGAPLAMFGGALLGPLIGFLVAELSKGQKTQAAFLTTPGGGPAGDFRSGISAVSPFGTVGLASGRSQSLAADFTRSIVDSLADFDRQVATLLDKSQIAQIATTLQAQAGVQQSARDFGEKEINRLFADRGRTIAEALLSGFKNANVEAILKSQGLTRGATTEQIGQGIQGVASLIRDTATGRRELRGDQIADFTSKMEALQDRFRQLAPSVQLLDGNLDGLNKDLETGIQALKDSELRDLRTRTLQLTDPFAAAIDVIAQEEQRLTRETAAMGTGMAEAANLIQKEREDLAKRATAPTQAVLDELSFGKLSAAQQRGVLGQRFTESLAGTDATAVASAARDLNAFNQKFFGSGSMFFESQTFIEKSLEAFNQRLRDQALAGTAASQTQTDILAANQNEQTDVLNQLLATTQSQAAEIVRLRSDLTLVLGKLEARG